MTLLLACLLSIYIAPTGFPTSFSNTTTPSSITVTWSTIDCVEQNGIITGYTVEFKGPDEASVLGEVVGQTFTASGLTPATHYTFRVAGVNGDGTGPFCPEKTITTGEPGHVTKHFMVISSYNIFLQIFSVALGILSSLCLMAAVHVSHVLLRVPAPWTGVLSVLVLWVTSEAPRKPLWRQQIHHAQVSA